MQVVEWWCVSHNESLEEFIHLWKNNWYKKEQSDWNCIFATGMCLQNSTC